MSTGTQLQLMLQQSVPARARRQDPQTSKDAAASWDKHKLTAVQTYVLSFFLSCIEGTDRELEEWIADTYKGAKFGPSSLRKRRGDLVEKGLLRDSGIKRDGMIVWQLMEAQVPVN